jgi:hypothetical protein
MEEYSLLYIVDESPSCLIQMSGVLCRMPRDNNKLGPNWSGSLIFGSQAANGFYFVMRAASLYFFY